MSFKKFIVTIICETKFRLYLCRGRYKGVQFIYIAVHNRRGDYLGTPKLEVNSSYILITNLQPSLTGDPRQK